MAIIHIRFKSSNQKRSGSKPKPAPKAAAGSGLRIERNREGILFFRQPKGYNDITTWHIHPSGEDLLRRSKIFEGQRLEPGMFKKLHAGGHLYTNSGKNSKSAKPHQAAANETRAKRTPASPSEIRRDRPGSTRVFTVRKQKTAIPKQSTQAAPVSTPLPSSVKPRPALDGSGDNPSKKQNAMGSASPRTQASTTPRQPARIHSGWLTPTSGRGSNQESEADPTSDG